MIYYRCDVIEAMKRGAVGPYPTPPHNPVPPFKIEPTCDVKL